MCGLLFSNNNFNYEQFMSALLLMKHRGPDAFGCYAQLDNYQLGHNRLKILDINDRTNQPFFSRSGKHVIIFNGEIYNYKELAKKYSICLETECDTELLVELYEKIGWKLLCELNGMFAFVVVNIKTKAIFIARDRLGIKPLYYLDTTKHSTFSSEIAPLVELSKNITLDEIAIRQYKKLRTFFGGRTIYNEIKMFPAGHYMLDGKVVKYWELPFGEKEPPRDDELLELLQSAVKYRCIADVSVGSYLSGGLDSTIITGLASKPDTWTVGFKDNNEFEWGRLAAKKFNSSHTEVLIDNNEFLDLARKMIMKRREPLSVPNEVLLFKMTREVKKKNTVVLSGEGADELFFGYDRIFRWIGNNEWSIEEFNQYYAYGSVDDYEIIEEVLKPYMKYSPLERVARFFQLDHLHGLLRRVDNSTMQCSVEARVPFVDHRLVELMSGVALSYRMRNGIVKEPLKRIFSNIVPKAIIERKKVGFPVNLNQIFELESGANSHVGFDRWTDFNLRVLSEM